MVTSYLMLNIEKEYIFFVLSVKERRREERKTKQVWWYFCVKRWMKSYSQRHQPLPPEWQDLSPLYKFSPNHKATPPPTSQTTDDAQRFMGH